LRYNASAGSYVLRASSADLAASASLHEDHLQLDYANVTLNLRDPGGQILATGSSATGSVSVAQVATAPGGYSWQIQGNSSDLAVPSYSLDHGFTKVADAAASGSFTTTGTNTHSFVADGPGYAAVNLAWGAGTLGMASLTAVLKGPSGQVLAQQSSSSGSLVFSATTAAAGTHTVEITNTSLYNVPSYSLITTVPKDHGAFSLQLKNASGTVVATGTGTKPTTLSTSVSPGPYTLVATAIGGEGTATLTGTYPARPAREAITYDGNDHATAIDDGTNTVSETLAPSGRVLRRIVTDSATGAVAEDTSFGYDSGEDSPAYSWPSAGGAPVTTYLDSGAGLSAIDVGGTVTYQHANLHGDVVGTTDAAGTFTALPTPDEFGAGQAPASRLGWLGAKERFAVGVGPGLIRMGVRMYEPRLGRFLEVDPVEGGSANDYDYCSADPVNCTDLAGTFNRRIHSRYYSPFWGHRVPLRQGTIDRIKADRNWRSWNGISMTRAIRDTLVLGHVYDHQDGTVEFLYCYNIRGRTRTFQVRVNSHLPYWDQTYGMRRGGDAVLYPVSALDAENRMYGVYYARWYD